MSSVQFYYPIIEFDRLFEETLGAPRCPRAGEAPTEARSRYRNVYNPRLDLHESKESNIMTATFELPGLTSNDIAIDVHQNRLTVSGQFVAPASDEEKNYVVRERRSGKFTRTLQLPTGTKPEDVKAKMENGVLMITFPKTTPEEEAKHIPIQ